MASSTVGDAVPGPVAPAEPAGRRTIGIGGLLVTLMLTALMGAAPAAAAPTVPAPTDLRATAVSSTRVDLAWAPVRKASSYRLLRSTTSGGPYTEVATTAATSHSDTSVAPARSYFYVVTATVGSRTSGFSNEAGATTPSDVPAAPTGLTAAASSSSAIDLAWQPSSGATGYRIVQGFGDAQVVHVVGAVTSFRDTGLAPATTYSYVVRATNSAGVSAESNRASATTHAAAVLPAAPTNLTAVADNYDVFLSWEPSSGATGYEVRRSETSGGTSALIGTTGTELRFRHQPPPGSTSYYVVRAVNSAGTSRNSNEASATTAPAAPTGFSAQVVDARPAAAQYVELTWSAPLGAESYRLERATVGSAYVEIAAPNGTLYRDFDVAPGTIYYYRLLAANGSGISGYVETKTTTNP